MPCYDAEAARENAENREAVPKLQERVHELTRLLCDAGKSALYGKRPSQELVDFWINHAREDAERGEPWFNQTR
jgi:hypothetical protein